MVIITGYLLVDEAQRDAYVEAHRDLMQRARLFDGCLDVAISADSVDPRRVNTVEVWQSSEALDAWRKQANAPQSGIEPADIHVQRFNAEDGGPLF